MRRTNTLILSLFILFILCTGLYVHWTRQNSEFESLIGQYPHTLGGIFTGTGTYYEYYQVNASGEERYYRVAREAESGKVLEIQEISYSDYLTYTGRALEMARSYVEGTGKLPQDAALITYNVTNLTVRLYYSIGSGERASNSSTLTSTLASPGREFIIATVNLASGNVTLRGVSFDELPKWVREVVKVLSRK
ncbi:hypothetical protein [Thermococcus henrietii]|uniref:hypothetical protein n=1 Tax=Thermococcus henrietii TaxID=2016361 RepID=UPI000C07D632|nr:hypothetical protein [Thermococcus henrietii]